MGLRLDIRDILFRRVDIASLVVFRVLFGALMAYDMGRYVAFGWVHEHYIDPPITFGYIGFHWVEVLPAPLMYAVFGMTVGAGIAIALGAFYRLSCFLFFLGHTYIFLVGAEFYLNHAYLISLVALLMMFMPAHRALSFDAIRVPKLHSREIHSWPLVLICGLFGIVYTFGAIAKVNSDWLFGNEPIRHWLAMRATTAVEPMSSLLRNEDVITAIAWGGMAFDLLVTPALVWKRTRAAAVVLALGFHLTNAYLFNIGIFPWFMIAATTLFFDPSWPRQLKTLGPEITHYIDDVVPEDFDEDADPIALTAADERRLRSAVLAFFAAMVLIPLRHHLYPGNVAWTEDGHLFAWRMKLRDKRGRAMLRLRNPANGMVWVVDPNVELSEQQVRKMVGHPDMLLQYVHMLRDRYRRDMGMDVEIRGDVFVSLNYRAEQRMVDPECDLARETHSLGPNRWLLPFDDTPLPTPVDAIESYLGRTASRLAIIARYKTGLPPALPARAAPVPARPAAPLSAGGVDDE